jgi:flavin reductase (DIM6/NTAB) family NADH-FMN oxidoreductase RutF/DNA-binding MarR family transcriptional regulator
MGATVDPFLLHAGAPADDLRSFRKALGQFTTGVTVVTTQVDRQPAAVTVNSFSSVSLEPPMVLWSLRRQSGNMPAFRRAGHFAVNVLAADQIDLANHFARAVSDKFVACEWAEGLGGAPLLSGVAAQFECRKLAEHDGGDHVVFLGEVVHYRCFDRMGLLFSQGRYALAVDHPGSPADLHLAAHPRDDFFMPLLVRAYAYLSDAFADHHDAEGITTNQSRVLAFLATRPGASVDAIASLTFLGQSAAQDAIVNLLAMGCVAPRPPGALMITPEGTERLRRILTRAHAFEEEKLADLPKEDIEATRRVLRALASREGQ